MRTRPVVTATGNTVNLLCDEFRVRFPNGHCLTMYAVAPRDGREELAAAQRYADELWAKEQQKVVHA